MARAEPVETVAPAIEAHAIPARYRTKSQWIAAGAKRQSPAAIGALIAAWTGLPIALWIGVVGLVVGALVGLGAGSGIGLAQTLGIGSGVGALAALLGALVGAVGGVALIYIYLILHPIQLIGAIVSGAIISALVVFVAVRAEPFLMRLRGYRELSRREKACIYPLLVETGRRMGLQRVPALRMSDQKKPGAWAHSRAIVLTSVMLGDYDASEAPPKPDLDDMALSAILAHELHHWDTADVVGSTVVWACFLPAALVVNGVSWVRERSEFMGLVLWIVCWPAWVSAKLVVIPLMMRRTRNYEYEADARAASLGDDYRLGLRRALDELARWEAPRTGWEDVLKATHPPIEHRVERLEERWVIEQPPRATTPTISDVEPQPTPEPEPPRTPRRTPTPEPAAIEDDQTNTEPAATPTRTPRSSARKPASKAPPISRPPRPARPPVPRRRDQPGSGPAEQ